MAPKPALSFPEHKFESARQRIGAILGPILLLVLWIVPIEGLSPEAHRLLAILGLVMVFWISEAIPLPATALFGPALCVVAGVAPVKEVFRNFADPIIFLFLGSFLLAQAMLTQGLNRRIAFGILGLKFVGASSSRLLLAFAAITSLLSMWMSNTATTAMMFPIGLAILNEMALQKSARTGRQIHRHQLPFGTNFMLVTAFAASVGGLATPVGTPPNLIGLAFLENQLKVRVTFFQWMLFGLPLTLLMVGYLVGYFNQVTPRDPDLDLRNGKWLQREKQNLGRLRKGEKNVLLAFGLTVALWVIPGAVGLILGAEHALYRWLEARIPESVAALLGSLLLFMLPIDFPRRHFTLSWKDAEKIDWGTILLFGGGLALGDLMFETGLAQWIGQSLADLAHAQTTLGLIVLFTLVAVFVSETTSNAASASMVVPVAIAVSTAAGVDAFQPALAACLGASMGFSLPVSTPPNAIVYGSGCIPLLKMVRHGLLLDLVGSALIILVVAWLVPLVFEP